MPTVKNNDAPDTLRPYLFHGMDLSWKGTDKDAVGDCPWCGRSGKFSVKIATGVWQCFVCQEGSGKGGGNATTFVRSLHKKALAETTTPQYEAFRVQRNLLFAETLKVWEVCRSPFTGEWMVPGYGVDGNLCNLYKYVPIKNSKGEVENRLLLTPTLGHQLHGMNLYNSSTDIVDICEGPWDGMALWEAWDTHQISEEGTIEVHTNGTRLSTLRNVIAVPGTKTFFHSWVEKMSGKIVNLWYDNDHPRVENGRSIEPAGIEGMRKVASLLYQAKEQPQEVNYLRWGDAGYNLDLPSGYDVKDCLRNNNA